MPSSLDDRDYWEKRLSSRFNLRGVGDVGLSEAYNRWLYRVRRRAFSLALRDLPLKPQAFDALDIGSGTGFYIERWLELAPKRLVGSDLTEASVQRLGDSFPHTEFTRCDIGAPLPASLARTNFDVVSAMDMLFHITDDRNYESAWRNFAELLKGGGYLIFSDNLIGRRLDGGHQVCRTEDYILSAMASNGFVLERIVPMFVLMNDPIRSQSMMLRKLFSIDSRLASRSETCGNLVGAALYLPELVAINCLRRGPSTEIVVCRRLVERMTSNESA